MYPSLKELSKLKLSYLVYLSPYFQGSVCVCGGGMALRIISSYRKKKKGETVFSPKVVVPSQPFCLLTRLLAVVVVGGLILPK